LFVLGFLYNYKVQSLDWLDQLNSSQASIGILPYIPWSDGLRWVGGILSLPNQTYITWINPDISATLKLQEH